MTSNSFRFIRASGRALALAGASFLGACFSAAAVQVAPYFYVGSGGSLNHAKQDAGLDSAILAFIVTDGRCIVDPRFNRMLEDARRFVASGGNLVISLGGAEGTYVEVACSDAQLLDVLEAVMQRSGTRRLDWDLEGRQLANENGGSRRTRVLRELQAKYPDLHVTFTLSGLPDGLSHESMKVLRTTLEGGARIDRVNVMTMSLGTKYLEQLSPSSLAYASILSFRAAANQLASLYPAKSRPQLHAMMGITPMIGTNDDGTIFTLADAQELADYVRHQRIGFISYWAYQRDRAQSRGGIRPLVYYSGVAQSNQQFYKLFRSAEATTAVENDYPSWEEGQLYRAGVIVNYARRLYVAKYANPGYIPTFSTYYWEPYDCQAASRCKVQQ